MNFYADIEEYKTQILRGLASLDVSQSEISEVREKIEFVQDCGKAVIEGKSKVEEWSATKVDIYTAYKVSIDRIVEMLTEAGIHINKTQNLI